MKPVKPESSPQFAIHDPEEIKSATRVADFMLALRGNPGVMGKILGAYQTPDEILSADKISRENGHDSRDGSEKNALSAVANVLSCKDDLQAYPDQLTAQAMRHAIEQAGETSREQLRILRLRALTEHVANYQQAHPLSEEIPTISEADRTPHVI